MTPFCQLTAEQHIHGGFFGGYFHLNPLQMSAADVQLLQGKASFTVSIQQMVA